MPTIKRIRRPLVRLARCMGILPEMGEDPFDRRFDALEVSAEATAAAARMRGRAHPPSVWILGVMPRSGTVYTGELIRLHPQVEAYPNRMWELPFLELSGDLLRTQERFLQLYNENRSRMRQHDFLRLSGGAFLSYLLGFVPPGRTALFKVPDVRYLRHFETWFPAERILLLMRDGRDVVASTLRTWPQHSFRQVARQWARATSLVLDYVEYRKSRGRPGAALEIRGYRGRPTCLRPVGLRTIRTSPGRVPMGGDRPTPHAGFFQCPRAGQGELGPRSHTAAAENHKEVGTLVHEAEAGLRGRGGSRPGAGGVCKRGSVVTVRLTFCTRAQRPGLVAP